MEQLAGNWQVRDSSLSRYPICQVLIHSEVLRDVEAILVVLRVTNDAVISKILPHAIEGAHSLCAGSYRWWTLAMPVRVSPAACVERVACIGEEQRACLLATVHRRYGAIQTNGRANGSSLSLSNFPHTLTSHARRHMYVRVCIHLHFAHLCFWATSDSL